MQGANVKKANGNRGYIKETVGVVEAGNISYSGGVGEKKMKEDLTAEQLDRCQRKYRKIYKVRNRFFFFK